MTGLMMRVEALFLCEEKQRWSRETVHNNYGRLFVMKKTDWLRKRSYGPMWKEEKSACLFLVVRCVRAHTFRFGVPGRSLVFSRNPF